MSARNTLVNKKIRRAQRELRKGRLPAQIDLLEWIKLRSNVTTTTAARLLLAGVLRVDSHKIGFKMLKGGRKVLDPYVSANLRGRIEIHVPENLADAAR